ncbi:GNAT family N-acetyltransferase [Amphibacillus cookii]|uniref:GNAT family N-acetyltransferase n=1 Tax=Amphibacillus cookii TaxID=767787 RepID=UPI001957FB10|nr:GNAT family protein [Amphibacillus cookii]MBM7541000.1 RimJ/RimL family protein N-acetyltransferase [Amphibacillus cookii]
MIRLEYFTKDDFQTLIDWNVNASTSFLYQWTGGAELTYPLTHAQLEAYLKGANKNGATRYIYRVVEQQTGQVIGHLQIAAVDLKQRSARISRVLIGEPRSRGQGYGQQMIRAACEIIFDRWQLHKASLGVFDFNQSALSCYQKVGFQIDGLLRHARKVGDDYWDLYEMSMLEDEWQAVKGDQS